MIEAQKHGGRRDRFAGMALDGVLLAALFTLSMWLNGLHADFPPDYHPDEPSKARQVLSHDFNFNHPHLLLTATRGLNEILGPNQTTLDAALSPRDAWRDHHQTIVRNGRWVSAAFAALAACALALAAGLHYDRLAGAAAGLMVALNHGLITRAHYMKEDTALLLGLAVMMLGLSWAWRRRGCGGWAAAALLGLGGGLAAAGKYVGFVPAAAGILWFMAGPFMGRWWHRLIGGLLALAVGFAVFCAANFEGVFPFDPMRRGFDREWRHVTTEHVGLVSDGVGRYAVDVIRHETTWPALLGVVAFVIGRALRGRRPDAIDWTLLLFPLAYAFLITRSAVQFDRYFLPTVVFVQALGGVGWVVLGREVLRWVSVWRARPSEVTQPPRRAHAVLCGIVVLVLWPGAWASWACVRQFGDDGRDRLARWLAENLEAERGRPYVVADAYAKVDYRALREAGHRTGRRTLDFRRYTLDDLREAGVTHVIACNLNYDRYLTEHRNPAPGGEEAYHRAVDNYRRLFTETNIVWQNQPSRRMPYYVNPTVTVFELTPPRTAQR